MIFLVFMACATEETKDTTIEQAPPDSESENQDGLTWTRDVQPLIEQHCVRCHKEGGQGTGDFTDFETVDVMADLMWNAMESGRMPPPVADPSCHDYLDSDKFYMPDDSRDIFAQWLEEGKAYGSEDDAQEYDHALSELKDPDIIVTIPEAYSPTFSDPNNPGNEYRCFSIKHDREEPFYVTELHPVIDNDSIVHHVVLAKGNENGILPGSDNPEGVDCIDGAFVTGDYLDSAMLAGWAPGGSPIRFPENAGLLIQPNEYIVIQMHYYQSVDGGENPTDQSGYAFKTTDQAPQHVVQMIPYGVYDFTIPAGDEAYSASTSYSFPYNFKLWGVFPHMHRLGAGYELSFDDQCVVSSDQYDFNNQVSYLFEEPISFTSGSSLNWSCTWNNSESNPYLEGQTPVDTHYGERTDEEMCFAFIMVSL